SGSRKPGLGATFAIYLPRVENALKAPEPQLPMKSLRGSETILVVEDEDAVRGLVGRVLQEQGYPVHSASGSAEALVLCAKNAARIDLMVTDVVMPQMSGIEL